ncbi:GATA zinc finger protein 3 [Elasticomyces elasticus]|nr:GATA zinc finger protein 3 [Elasticomyces elasticus]KAK3639049.1 GATA zinc finger protein 3 [Elasticomyces elasticus]KAK4915653.1 GATA zinc finger protein 3 [Elasticomyces elasticus]KAK5752639.1 GATA zinc finger protein 3 [Elasticomyces elasticus]
MNGSQYAPAATAGGQSATSTGPPTCQNCSTSTTPLWRRDESGAVLCNACGLFLKLHGRPRPISLKTDVIKSRNRVKGGVQAQNARRREGEENNGGNGVGGSLAAAHPDVAHAGSQQSLPPQQLQHVPFSTGNGQQDRQQRRPSEAEMVERSRTPNPYPSHNNNQLQQQQHQHPHHAQQRRGSDRDPNIAPQHIFDTVSLTVGDDYPPTAYRVPSPSNLSANGGAQLDAPLNYDALSAQNRDLRTRVSELEVINGLFRGRVGELESSEAEARRAAQRKEEEIEKLRAELRGLESEGVGLRKRVRELEGEGEEGRRRKMARVVAGSDMDGEEEWVKVPRVEVEGVKLPRVEVEGEGERDVGIAGRAGRSNFMMP